MPLPTWPSWALAALVGYLVFQWATKQSKANLPPGPKPLPVLGNIRDLPPRGKLEYKHWLEHKDRYGPISSVTVLGMTLVTIHDRKLAHELLDKNSGKTSGRPEMVMANRLCGFDATVGSQGYTPTFRRYRRYLHQELGTKTLAAQFQNVQEVEINRQLVRTLNSPEKWMSHIKTTAAATILKMTYGYCIDPTEPDVLVTLVEQTMGEFTQAAVPMAWAVDIMPALRLLPEGIPGIKFKETARRWRKNFRASGHLPYNFVRRQMTSLTHRPSYVSKLVEQLASDSDDTLTPEDEHAVIWTAASLYGAASDSSVITMKSFTAAMALFPEVQKQAQAEIDRVIGMHRLPTFADRENLPYVNALVKEVSRWWPITPMGFPHSATEEFEFDGMLIPKGAVIQTAVWWFMHDPEVYPSPERFDPERYLTPRNEPDPTTETFGYGRRICPGRFFGEAGVFLNIAKSLAVFNITKAVGEDGIEIDTDLQPKPGVLAHPTEFAFRVAPRSEAHITLIEDIEREQPVDAGDSKFLDEFEILHAKR